MTGGGWWAEGDTAEAVAPGGGRSTGLWRCQRGVSAWNLSSWLKQRRHPWISLITCRKWLQPHLLKAKLISIIDALLILRRICCVRWRLKHKCILLAWLINASSNDFAFSGCRPLNAPNTLQSHQRRQPFPFSSTFNARSLAWKSHNVTVLPKHCALLCDDSSHKFTTFYGVSVVWT